MSTETIRVGTYNVHHTSAAETIAADLAALTPHADVIALPEAGGRRFAHVWATLPDGWRVVPGAPPYIYRTAALTLESSDVVTVAAGRHVAPVKGRRSNLPPLRVHVADFTIHASGQAARFVAVHAPAHIERRGLPFPGQAARVRMNAEGLSRVAAIMHEAERRGALVFALGDFNTDALADRVHRSPKLAAAILGVLGGYHVNWRRRPARGTFGRRVIDSVWSNLPASSSRVLDGFHSDHRPAVAVYTLPADPRARLIAAAQAEVGYQEGRAGGHWNNRQKYAAEVPGLAWADGQPWCAVFVAAMARRAGVGHLFPVTASCDVALSWWRDRGRFSEYPALGAQVFYGTSRDAVHTGIVTGFDAVNVWTVEGNTNTNGSREGDGVYVKRHARRDPYLIGYGVPAFPGSTAAPRR